MIKETLRAIDGAQTQDW